MNFLNGNLKKKRSRMPAKKIHDLYITDAEINIILEEKSVAADTDTA